MALRRASEGMALATASAMPERAGVASVPPRAQHVAAAVHDSQNSRSQAIASRERISVFSKRSTATRFRFEADEKRHRNRTRRALGTSTNTQGPSRRREVHVVAVSGSRGHDSDITRISLHQSAKPRACIWVVFAIGPPPPPHRYRAISAARAGAGEDFSSGPKGPGSGSGFFARRFTMARGMRSGFFAVTGHAVGFFCCHVFR